MGWGVRGLGIADCRLQIGDCRLQIADWGLQIAECTRSSHQDWICTDVAISADFLGIVKKVVFGFLVLGRAAAA